MGKFDGIFIASDMDGTLLDDTHAIQRETIQALEYFTQNGGYFSLATGRTRPATAAYRKLLPCNGPGVYLNGAIICDEALEKVIYMEGLDDGAKQLAREVMEAYPHLGIEVFLLDHSYVCRMCEVTRQHFVNLDIPYTLCGLDEIPEPTQEWGKINFTGEHDEVLAARPFIDRVKDKYNLTFSTPVYYEMTCKGGQRRWRAKSGKLSRCRAVAGLYCGRQPKRFADAARCRHQFCAGKCKTRGARHGRCCCGGQ